MGGAAAGAARGRACGAIIGCGIRRHKAGRGRVGELGAGVGGVRGRTVCAYRGLMACPGGRNAGIGDGWKRVSLAVRGLA